MWGSDGWQDHALGACRPLRHTVNNNVKSG